MSIISMAVLSGSKQFDPSYEVEIEIDENNSQLLRIWMYQTCFRNGSGSKVDLARLCIAYHKRLSFERKLTNDEAIEVAKQYIAGDYNIFNNL